jgi:hypothetical protein
LDEALHGIKAMSDGVVALVGRGVPEIGTLSNKVAAKLRRAGASCVLIPTALSDLRIDFSTGKRRRALSGAGPRRETLISTRPISAARASPF